ncbi:MAG: DUF4157 domain-containing protein [Acidobacteriota bacterium]|nr:DUF4157 domain-containing protein [Acidobacteriota bacterium]
MPADSGSIAPAAPSIGQGKTFQGLSRQEDSPLPAEEEEEEGVPNTEENAREMEESNVSPQLEPGAPAPRGSRQESLQRALGGSGGGQALDAGTRGFMESRFGHDFSRVRVHNDSSSHAAAQSIRARAFTHGQNIFFAQGSYRPGTSQGRKLLAHELTHTLQQSRRGSKTTVQRSYCPSHCVKQIKAGKLCKSKKVKRDGCSMKAASGSDNISHIRVRLSARQVDIFKNGKPNTTCGSKESFECTPNQSATPQGKDVVGKKCGEKHTSWKRYNMAWFTAFKSSGMEFGFHNSQPVGKGLKSHGCVRVRCDKAKKIHDGSASNWTSIEVVKSGKGTASNKCGSGSAGGTATGTTYTVEARDSVSKIAKKFGVTEDAIVEANDLEDRHSIQEGQVLTIPPAPAPKQQPKPEAETPEKKKEEKAPEKKPEKKEEEKSARPTKKAFQYTVKKDDKVSVLAKRFGVSEKSIVDANKLEDPDRIREGQVLTIPEEGK